MANAARSRGPRRSHSRPRRRSSSRGPARPAPLVSKRRRERVAYLDNLSYCLTSTGRNLAVVAPLTANGGKARICLDPETNRQSCSMVDLGPGSGFGSRWEVFVRNGLNASVTHKVQVTVVSGRVDLDAFVMLR